MQALILAGGEGTRLRPLTRDVPKPVLPLAGRPHLLHMTDWLAAHGVDQVVVSCGYRADLMRKLLPESDGPELSFVEEPDPRGTAGAIRFAADNTDVLGERFFALNGDTLTDIDLSALVRRHEQSGARATIALHPVADSAGYGLVSRRDDGKITEFLEKPDPAQVAASEFDTDEINAGVYLLEREVVDEIPADRNVSIERETFPGLVGRGLYGCRLEGYWLDMGTPGRFMQATADILEGRVRTSVGAGLPDDGLGIGAGAQIAETAALKPPVLIGENADVGPTANITGPAVIGPRSVIGEGANLNRSVLFEECRVGEGAEIGRAILGAGVDVAPGASIADGAVIGQGERVPATAGTGGLR